MNTRNIPALVMLTAGLTASIVMYRMKYELHTMLWILLLVLFVFFIFGCMIKFLLDKFGMQTSKEKQDPDDESESDGQTDEQNKENTEEPKTEKPKDGSVRKIKNT